MAITKFKREDLKQLIEDENFDFPFISLIADKLRAIYSLFGYRNLLEDFDFAQENIEQLIMSVYKDLDSDPQKTGSEARSSMAMVEGWFDEDGFLCLDYYFNLE